MSEDLEHTDPWANLRQHTDARVGIGRAGNSIPVKQMLNFKLAHAHARDAVYSKLDNDLLDAQLQVLGLPVLHLESKAGYREQYLKRPDYGRVLSGKSVVELENFGDTLHDIVIIIADGLSANAVNQNAVKLLQQLLPMLQKAGFKAAPVCLVEHGRVAIGDDIAAVLKANLSVVLIGERPGLSAADSMGAYLTYAPVRGLTDEARNCVSNIRQGGLPHHEAVGKLYYLIQQAFRRKISGIMLKDDAANGYFP